MLNDWEKIARELGDYDLVQVFNVFEMYTEMVRKEDSDCLGNWVPSRTAAKEIFRLRKQVEVLERVREAAEKVESWLTHSTDCSRLVDNVPCNCGFTNLIFALHDADEEVN